MEMLKNALKDESSIAISQKISKLFQQQSMGEKQIKLEKLLYHKLRCTKNEMKSSFCT
jgi:hypothetical protein